MFLMVFFYPKIIIKYYNQSYSFHCIFLDLNKCYMEYTSITIYIEIIV